MNYVIEGGLDFSQLLKLKDDDNDELNENNTCLLSGEPLELNHITLPCKHSFNYKPLYNEILSRKFKHNRYSRTAYSMSINQIECPYCRKISHKLLPYYPQIPNIDKINGVNSPKKYTMATRTCSHVLKCGPNKGTTCSSQGFLYFDNKTQKTTCFCLKHWNLQQKIKNKAKTPIKCVKIKKNKPTLSKLEESLYKKYRVVDLKNILRENKQKLTGNKYDLIKRVILKKLI
tara:strand:- start:521 stop:1213 length:693 start_codon:yes stop_codon:yes gene_type:complete